MRLLLSLHASARWGCEFVTVFTYLELVEIQFGDASQQFEGDYGQIKARIGNGWRRLSFYAGRGAWQQERAVKHGHAAQQLGVMQSGNLDNGGTA